MEVEIYNWVKVWTIAITSSMYCYTLSKATSKGTLRVILVMPIIFLFSTISFRLTTIHLGLPTFFYLAWLGNFKLLLFCFDAGPLPQLQNSLPHFVCTLVLPIKPVSDPSPTNEGSDVDPKEKSGFKNRVLFCVKCLVLVCLIISYEYKERMPYALVFCFYVIHLYFGLETIFAICGALAHASLGLHFAPQFNEPYLTTSLQDFWGNRWNLMVSDVLRMTIYTPICNTATPIIGRKPGMVVGVVASFLVSGLMHELIYYYITRVSPTWEVTCFFVLHGICTATEVIVKKAISDKWRLNHLISRTLTIAFVIATGVWLFTPQIFRNEVPEKVIAEYPIMFKFFMRKLFGLVL